MKIAFEEIEKELSNPFFEVRCLGKEAIKQRTQPVDNFNDTPDNFHFVEWKKEDEEKIISYSFNNTRIGRILIANTSKGICFLGFTTQGEDQLLEDFKHRFPHQEIKEETTDWQKTAIDYCNGIRNQEISLHLRGTGFQLNVWKRLTRIPEGSLSTYGSIISNFKGTQAIGTAVGSNPVSYIIPCHRIVRNDGSYEGYHWGPELKRLLLAYELQSL